jgi:hypothetical protein
MFREVPCKSYRVVYVVDAERQRVVVARIWQAARGTPDLDEWLWSLLRGNIRLLRIVFRIAASPHKASSGVAFD